jgi:cadmium resistance protein CadD (predicted permease)
VNAGVIAQAAGLFAVTSFDDIVVQSLFFAQGTGQRGATQR